MVKMIQWDSTHRKWVIKNSGTDMNRIDVKNWDFMRLTCVEVEIYLKQQATDILLMK